MLWGKTCLVIIVTYNGYRYIERCLQSLYNQACQPEILVIDNCSSDGTVLLVQELFPKVKIIQNEINIGFGAANNIGLKIAVQKKSDYVLLLNQDAYLERFVLDGLIEFSVKNLNFGILSPIHLNGSGTALDTRFTTYLKSNFTALINDLILLAHNNKIYSVDFINAACWLLPLNTIKKVGLFDSIFFHYGEDENYCQRVIYHKLKIGVVPKLFVAHDRVQTLYKVFGEKKFDLELRVLKVKLCNVNNHDFDTKFIAELVKKISRLIVSISMIRFGDSNYTLRLIFHLFKLRKSMKQSLLRNRLTFDVHNVS